VVDEQGKVVGVLTASDVLARLAQVLQIEQIDEPAEPAAPEEVAA
jgi:CBS domain containing-hemolysin-like protein